MVPLSLCLPLVIVSSIGQRLPAIGVWSAICTLIVKPAASAVAGSARAPITASAAGPTSRRCRLAGSLHTRYSIGTPR
jgi:hypothetical protein